MNAVTLLNSYAFDWNFTDKKYIFLFFIEYQINFTHFYILLFWYVVKMVKMVDANDIINCLTKAL